MAETEQQAANDAFSRVSLGLPSDEKLRLMTDLDIDISLSSYSSGTAQHSFFEREKLRRESLKNAKSSEDVNKQKPEPAPDHWYKKPVGVIGIAIISGLLLYFATLLVKRHLGLL